MDYEKRGSLGYANFKAPPASDHVTPKAASEKRPGAAAAATLEVQRDERGYRVLQGKQYLAHSIGAFTDDASNDEGRPQSRRIAYLEGLRGLLAIQTLLWVFFRLFAPAVVTDRDVDGTYPAAFAQAAPKWMTVLRKLFSPLLFNGSLQANMLIVLMGRVNMQTWVERREATALAGQAWRRPWRLVPPVALALGLTTLLTATGAFKHAPYLAQRLQNPIAEPPEMWDQAIEYFNSVLAFFAAPYTYKLSRPMAFLPPSGIAWSVNVVFKQTYVLMIFSYLLPYIILKYKFSGLLVMILVTAWVGRWSWYTLTGLGIAEFSVVYRQLVPERGIPLSRTSKVRVSPTWVALALLGLGVVFKYIWIAALPDMYNDELVAHVDYATGKLNRDFDAALYAYPRYDDWLVSTGLLLLLELSPGLRAVFSAKPLVYVGRWGFAIALSSGSVMLAAGSALYYHLVEVREWESTSQILGVLFVTMVPLAMLSAEVASLLVDQPSLWLSRASWRFMKS